MALDNGTLSAADVAAVTNGNGGWFGNDGSFWIIVLFLFAIMGNGWGNGFGGGMNTAVPYIQNDVQSGFDQAAIMAGINGINTSLANAEISRCNLTSNLTNQLNTIAMGQQQCLKEIKLNTVGTLAA